MCVLLLTIAAYAVAVSSAPEAADQVVMLSRGGAVYTDPGSNFSVNCVVSVTNWDHFFDQLVWYKVGSASAVHYIPVTQRL